jgi:hypothetical protein
MRLVPLVLRGLEAHTGCMSDNLIALRRCASRQEAELLKSVLAADGIDSQIPDEYALGVNPGFTNAFGGVRLCVRDVDAKRAEELLNTIPTGD